MEDTETREVAKVNFGMANASKQWNKHVQDILKHVSQDVNQVNRLEEEEEIAEKADDEEQDM